MAALEPGDLVRLHPKVALTVASIDPGPLARAPAGTGMGDAASSAPYDYLGLRRASAPGLTTRLIAETVRLCEPVVRDAGRAGVRGELPS